MASSGDGARTSGGDAPAPCPGCGLVTGPANGPTHPYMRSSPGCWARYAELLAVDAGQMAVDAYAVQHAGVPERRAAQSVAVHLVSLCAALERGWPPDRGPDLLRRAVASPPPGGWPWLDPPQPIGSVTVADVVAAPNGAARARAARTWAEDLWAAYGSRHDAVRGWTDAVLDVRR